MDVHLILGMDQETQSCCSLMHIPAGAGHIFQDMHGNHASWYSAKLASSPLMTDAGMITLYNLGVTPRLNGEMGWVLCYNQLILATQGRIALVAGVRRHAIPGTLIVPC